MLTSEDLATLRAIVDSTDREVTVSHKLRALETLAISQANSAPEGALVLAEWVMGMTDDELEKELAEFMGPYVAREADLRLGLCPPPEMQALVDRGRDLDWREADLRAREASVEARERGQEGAARRARGGRPRGRGGLGRRQRGARLDGAYSNRSFRVHSER